METKFCLICCYSFNPPSGGAMPHFRDYRNNRLLKFCEGLLPNLKSSLVLDESDCLKLEGFGNVVNFEEKGAPINNISLCNDCLSVIMTIVEGKSRVAQVEEQIRLLQGQGVREMDKLCKEMRILEELMEGGDTQCLEEGSSPSTSCGTSEIVEFRHDILKATKDLRAHAHGSNLSNWITSHNCLCNCGGNINLTAPITAKSSTSRIHFHGNDYSDDPSSNGDVDLEDVKLFNEDPSSPFQEVAAIHKGDLENEEGRGGFGFARLYDNNKSAKRSNDGNKMIRPKEKSVLVLKILKKAKHRRRLHIITQSGGAGRPRDPIRNEFDVERATGKAKCRMCERVLSCRVDVMKSHKLCCPARRNRDGCGVESDFLNASRLTEVHSKPVLVEPTDGIEIPGIKTPKPKHKGKVTSRVIPKSHTQGRPRDSIRNKFDLTETGKAKCRDCNRSIFYRVDVMKSHKLVCLSNPKYGGQAELELDELTGELRPAGSTKRRRHLRRKPGATPKIAGRPKDSIRDEFELTDTGKAKCKNCNISISYRVDVMKKHKMCCRQKRSN